MKKIICLITMIILVSIQLVQAKEMYFYHNDHLGNPVIMTNDEGEVVWEQDHDPFGAPITNKLNESDIKEEMSQHTDHHIDKECYHYEAVSFQILRESDYSNIVNVPVGYTWTKPESNNLLLQQVIKTREPNWVLKSINRVRNISLTGTVISNKQNVLPFKDYTFNNRNESWLIKAMSFII